jgi:GT2 family glycosyltransferase
VSAGGRPEISVVIVTWNSVRDIARCLCALRRALDGRDAEVLVVDNGSSDGTLDAVRAGFPAVRCIAPARNLGFAGGSNRGVAEAGGRVLLLLNPDTEVAPDAVARLVDGLGARRVAAAAPLLLNPDGTLQSAGERFLTPWEYLLRRVLLLPKPARAGANPYPTDWASGACLAIRREAWDAVGPLDENYFMYAEDLEWCWRARRAGWEVEVVPAARVTHYKGASTRQNLYPAVLSNAINTVRWFRLSGGRRSALLGGLVVALGLLGRALFAAPTDPGAAWINTRCAWAVLRGGAGPAHR